MNNNLQAGLFFLIVMMLSLNTQAKPNKHTDFAQVVQVSPVYQTVERRVPKETCWTEVIEHKERNRHRGSSTPSLLGGLIGGAIGHELGHGKDNQKIGAVVGSILGMSIGSDIQRSKRQRHNEYTHLEEVERCRVSHTIEADEVLEGYEVTYRYKGREYQTFMHEHPGRKIRVAVAVRPI